MAEIHINYDFICSMNVQVRFLGEMQYYMYINSVIDKQLATHDISLETQLDSFPMSIPVLEVLAKEDPIINNLSIIDIQTELNQKSFLGNLLSIDTQIEGKENRLDIDSQLLVWLEMEPVTLLDIDFNLQLEQYHKLFPIEFSTWPNSKFMDFPIDLHYSGVDLSLSLFDMLVDYEMRTLELDLPINVRLSNRVNRIEVPVYMKVPKWDYIYSLFSNIEVVRGAHKSLLCFLEIESWFVRYELDSYMNLTPQLSSLDLFDINCILYPTSSVELDSYMQIEGVNTRRDIDCYMISVIGIEKEFGISLDITGDFEYEMYSHMSVVNESVKLEDVGRIGIFVDPLWRYEPWVLKNSVGTIMNRAVYQNHQRFTLVYGGSPRANFDIHKFSMCYNIAHKEVPYTYMPTNVTYNIDQMMRFTMELFTFNNYEIPIVSKVFIFSDNPYMRTCTYLKPLIQTCDLYKIPIVMITSKGDISGTDPANPNRYQSTHKVDPNYPLEHQPHFSYGSGSKHIEVYDDSSIV